MGKNRFWSFYVLSRLEGVSSQLTSKDPSELKVNCISLSSSMGGEYDKKSNSSEVIIPAMFSTEEMLCNFVVLLCTGLFETPYNRERNF